MRELSPHPSGRRVTAPGPDDCCQGRSIPCARQRLFGSGQQGFNGRQHHHNRNDLFHHIQSNPSPHLQTHPTQAVVPPEMASTYAPVPPCVPARNGIFHSVGQCFDIRRGRIMRFSRGFCGILLARNNRQRVSQGSVHVFSLVAKSRHQLKNFRCMPP